MQRDSYNPVLIYKPLGSSLANNPLIKKQDFILGIMTEAQLEFLQLYGKNIIMMDSTHGTNQYGYLLTTIMVSDDNHEGLPIAVCYLNRVSSDVLEPFFEEIKNRLPHLRPKVFMSDDDPALCNAWRRVFGEVEVTLLCSWHVSQSWNRNLNADEDSNRLRREKEKEAILKEMEKSVVHEEPTELVYEQVERDAQLLNNVIKMANAEQIKRIGQDVKNILQYMGVSPSCSSLPSIQHFPANKNIVQQRQQQKSRHFKKQKLANDTTRQEHYNCQKRGSPYREMPPYHVKLVKNITAAKKEGVLTERRHHTICQVIYSQFGLAIHQNDHQARCRFVEWAQNEIAVVPDFHKRILFSDEAHFWLNGYVNKQNCRIWSEANPQVYVETPLHPEKLTVWCALWTGGIINPYFFKNDGHNVTVNGDRYRAMITNFFIPELNNHDVQELWFQQDGATCHTARATIDLLKDTFGDRLISRFGPVNWPPRSCDLTPLDYFLWGYVKSLVYADKPQTLDHLEDNIRRVIADIRPQMLEKVMENWTSRLDYIRASRGSHMPEII
ncbi:transposase [Trichonephila clavipes]|nr:transposase [Trichonephila clavipes]